MTRLIYTTWPDRQSAETAAKALLDDRLIACANILAPSQSIFHWDDQICQEEEVVVLFKTHEDVASTLRDRLIVLHPYDEPCILALPIDAEQSASGFISWIQAETRSNINR